MKDSRIADQQLRVFLEMYCDSRSLRIILLLSHSHSHFRDPWPVINYLGRVVSRLFDDQVFHILNKIDLPTLMIIWQLLLRNLYVKL